MNRNDTVLSSGGRRSDDNGDDVGPLVAIDVLGQPGRPVPELLQLLL